MPARYIALAKAEEKLHNSKKAVAALENAYELDPNVATLRQILAIYEGENDTEAAAAVMARIETQIARDNAAKRKRLSKSASKQVSKTGKTSKMRVKSRRTDKIAG